MPSRFKQCTPMWWGSTRWCHTSPCSFRQSMHAWTAWTNLVPSEACSSKRWICWDTTTGSAMVSTAPQWSDLCMAASRERWYKHSAACVKWRCEICPFMLASVKQSVYTTQVSQLLEPIGLPASASWRKTIAHMRSRPVRWSNTSFSDIWVEKCICHLLYVYTVPLSHL